MFIFRAEETKQNPSTLGDKLRAAIRGKPSRCCNSDPGLAIPAIFDQRQYNLEHIIIYREKTKNCQDGDDAVDDDIHNDDNDGDDD